MLFFSLTLFFHGMSRNLILFMALTTLLKSVGMGQRVPTLELRKCEDVHALCGHVSLKSVRQARHYGSFKQ